MTRQKTRRRYSSALLASTLLLAACTGQDAGTESNDSTTGTTESPEPTPVNEGAPAGFERYYEQSIEWQSLEDCGECASIEVPLDWENPEGDSIEVVLARLESSAAERPPLLMNPGGPGASGIDTLAFLPFSEEITQNYNVVTFDPRGVQRSSPVNCGDDDYLNGFLRTDAQEETPEGYTKTLEIAAEFTANCVEHSGELLEYVDTLSTVRDMHLIHSLLGSSELNYLGFSYGTVLGAWYAELYPQQVGRMVLDGAVDPNLTADESGWQQGLGFSSVMRSYLEDCMTSSQCPFSGGLEAAQQQLIDLVDEIEADPFPLSSGGYISSTEAFYGLAAALYSSQSWPALTMAFVEVTEQGTADTLMQLANLYLSRDPDGTFTDNSLVAFSVIQCADTEFEPMSFEEYQAEQQRRESEDPLAGNFFGAGSGCVDWPVGGKLPVQEVSAPGAAPIVVIGTTNDPATPYVWSQALAEQLESGVLWTYQGDEHGAYLASTCIAEAVDQYLVTGEVPKTDLVC